MMDVNIDLVICVEATKAMLDIADDVKQKIKHLIEYIPEYSEEQALVIKKLRVKLILFRDYGCCPEAMIESGFVDIIEDKEKIFECIDNIEFKGGYGYCNALEAIALALKSNWTTEGKFRHGIIVFSKSQVHSLGLKCGISSYPVGMPTDLAQLGAWWEGTDQTLGSTYQPKSGSLVAFVPNAEPWTFMQAWNGYWSAFSPAGAGLDDVDIQSAIDLIFPNDL